MTTRAGTRAFERESQQIRQWIDGADRVLIGAGAGLSADAGVDYTDEATFARTFPSLVKRGLRAPYQMIGHAGLPTEVFWGYWLTHVDEVRFGEGRRRVYELLFDLVRDKDWFVLTSNVDALFARNGFDPARVCSIQGDFAFLQCYTPCSDELWPSAPVLARLLPEIDPATQALREPALAPACPRCGGEMFFNVRGGHWFVETPWRRQFEVLREWLPSASNERLLVLDIGSGFNTPSVVRWPMERTARSVPTSRFVRINRNDLPLEQLRQLDTNDCHASAWLRVGGAPMVIDGSLRDLRLENPVHDNLTALMLERAATGCPTNVPPWTPPRADVIDR